MKENKFRSLASGIFIGALALTGGSYLFNRTTKGDNSSFFILPVSISDQNYKDIYRLYTVSPNGNAIDISKSETDQLDPVVSQDGNQIVFSQLNSDTNRYELHLRTLSNPDSVKLPVPQNLLFASYPRWISEDSIIFTGMLKSDKKIQQVYSFNIKTNLLRPLTNLETNYELRNPQLSPDHRKLLLQINLGQRNNWVDKIYMKDLESGKMSPLTETNGSQREFAISPDSQYVVFSNEFHIDSSTISSNLKLVNLKDSSLKTIDLPANSASWSPDSKKILFLNNSRIFITDLQFSNIKEISTLPATSSISTCSFGADGRIYFYGTSNHEVNLYSMTATGQDIRKVITTDPNLSTFFPINPEWIK